MKKQLPDPPSALEPHPQTTPSSDQRFTIAFWMMKYETFLFRTAPYSTYERCTRVFDRLFATFPEKRFLHECRRADLEDFKLKRLEQGTSPKTVNIECRASGRFGISCSERRPTAFSLIRRQESE